MSIESTVFHFENGIPGFEHLHQFAFSEIEGELPMKLMKSVEDEEISLLIVSPFFIYPEYEWELPDSSKQELFIQSRIGYRDLVHYYGSFRTFASNHQSDGPACSQYK